MKRFTLLSLFALLTICAQAYDFKSGDLYYNIIGNSSLEVTAGPNSYDGLTSVVIPSSVDYYGSAFSVSGIGASAFADCSSLTSVTISNSITSIGESAFSGCIGLTSISIPSSVTSIGKNAFLGILNVVYSGSATGAPWGASYINNYADGNLVYTDTTKTVLLVCNKVATGEITIPNSVTSVGESAFENCSSLTSVIIPSGVTSIGDRAFSGCSGLTSIMLPNSITSMGEEAFYNCRRLTSITLPDSITSIGAHAFSLCSSLTSVTIPNRVTTIGTYAFGFCGSLTSITIPNSVTSIRNGAFSYCSSLISVTLPNSVTSIGTDAFSTCTGLTSIVLPNSITSIGEEAFYDCSSLTSIALPNSIKSIGNNTFKNCSGLTSVIFSDSITSIGQSVFFGCSSLTSIALPNSMKSIGKNAFYDCSGLTSVMFPDSITSIGESAFSGCSSLTSITLPNSIKSIRENTFKNCSGLTSVMFPDSITSIGESAFSSCSSLTSITLPNSMTSIEPSVFSDCSGLTSVILPDSITSIGESAFSGCSGLTSITLPNSITSIGSSAFSGCSGLTSVILPDNITSIQDSTFKDCSGLISVTIPNGVYDIFCYAFFGCSSLTSITIPNSVNDIWPGAFYGCSELKVVRCLAPRLRRSGSYAFEEDPDRILYVLCNSMDYYYDYWFDTFWHIECISDEPIVHSVTTIPSENAVTFEWSSYPNAATYTLEFNDNSIIFDNQGETEGGEKAELTQDGKFRYYQDSLESNTTYDYEMWSKDANGNPLCIYWNYFTTQQAEPVEAIVREVHSDNAVFFEWSIVENAGSYELIVQSKDQYGSEIFDSNGNVQTDDNQAVVTEEGLYKFGFTSLNPATEYNYQLIIKGHYSDTLFTGSGSFVTDPAGKMTIVPSANDFVFAWYANPLATSYEFTLLSANQNMLYSCTFDGQGKLWENGKYIEAILSDKTFIWGVKGVDPSTLYYYTMYAKYNEDKILNAYSGSFVTLDDSDGINNVQDNGGASAPRKIIRDGRVYIERDGKTYTIMGTEISDR